MTVGETIAHLAECAEAFLKSTRGESHDWGSYTPPDSSPAGLLTTLQGLRASARDLIAKSTDSAVLKAAVEYLCLHDAYHVGQICALRLSRDPDWNAYAIYEA
jgi:uncharacterized damage-inducible protein DinB